MTTNQLVAKICKAYQEGEWSGLTKNIYDRDVENPYSHGSEQYEAWEIGYKHVTENRPQPSQIHLRSKAG